MSRFDQLLTILNLNKTLQNIFTKIITLKGYYKVASFSNMINKTLTLIRPIHFCTIAIK